MRVLITGAAGFVGLHLLRALDGMAAGIAVSATSMEGVEDPTFGTIEVLDVTDAAAVNAAIVDHQPTHVLHLAGLAAVRSAAFDPAAAWAVHVQGTLNIAQAVMAHAPHCWMINVGSGLIYGDSAKSGQALSETTVLSPVDDYGVTKAAADLALGALARRGLRVIRLRPFNHTGAGQTEAFAIPAFAMQIARIEAGLEVPVLRVGNLDAERDFLDVRDVVKAYVLAVLRANDLESGIILNIASGVPRRIGDLLERLLSLSRARITVEQDPARLRPSDIPRIVGDATLAHSKLGWRPECTLDDMLLSVMDDCRDRVRRIAKN